MKHNTYSITFEDFIKVIKVPSSHIVFYAILDDRLHFEMPIENAVFVSQKFIASIMEEKIDHILQDPMKLFMKMNFADRTLYRFFPDEDNLVKMKSLKLYSSLVTVFADKEAQVNNYTEQPETKEYDGSVIVMQDDKKILEFKKVQ